MSNYVQKRVDYINNWPKSQPFSAEQNYEKRCNNFIETHQTYPFRPVKVWWSNDDTYNRTISHLIDSLDMMPYHPNFSFQFIFSGLDYFTNKLYSKNTTSNLKHTIADLVALIQQNADIKRTLDSLFEVLPVNTSLYLYQCLYGNSGHNSNVKNRVCTDQNNSRIPNHDSITNLVFSQYGYDPANYNNGLIRNGALLYRKMFVLDTVEINGQSITISNELRLYLLLCGVIYSLRNDALHGSSMSSTKSSLTSPERYASNYYCFLTTYTVLMIMLIMKTITDPMNQSKKYLELKNTTLENVQNFKLLFGNHIK